MPYSNSYSYITAKNGTGVNVYVIDTGILTNHNEFGGTAAAVFDDVGGTGANFGIDCEGHGTHVAGTIGGATYGVAKGVNLKAVRVFDCFGNGDTSTVIMGVDWVKANRVLPAVVNMSLGTTNGPNADLDTAVRNLINSGVPCVVAAGNKNEDASNTSPARVAEAITVGATNIDDTRGNTSTGFYSNFGPGLDIFAPGTGITSAGITSNSATAVKTGTSMASPHVAGAVAQYLSAFPGASLADVASAITLAATPDKVISPGTGSPNRLLFNFFLQSTSTNAASFQPPPAKLAPESIVAGFGSFLATTTASAGTGVSALTGTTLPTVLGGTSVTVKDSTAVTRDAPLFFVSPLQVNYQMPAGTAPGTAIITFKVNGSPIANENRLMAFVAPGLFSANSSGNGTAAGYILRVRPDNTQAVEPLTNINFGPVGDNLYLILFGTGIRFRSALTAVTASINGITLDNLYAGPQPDFIGEDQINLGALPRSLAGSRTKNVLLTVDAIAANTLTVSFQ